MLGGGGLLGGAYAVGALEALDTLRPPGGRFDIYIGTSAGAFVAALAAAGIAPSEMMRVLEATDGGARNELVPGSLLAPNVGELMRAAALLPLRVAELLARAARARDGDSAAIALLAGLAAALPPGLYDTGAIERYLARVLGELDCHDDFSRLERELYVVATDLDRGERVVFGAETAAGLPISTAVSASAALPGLYAPVAVDGRELVDGGVVSTTNLDLALEHGAELVFVVNPLVPFVAPGTRISQLGLAHVAFQAFKLLAHERLRETLAGWELRHPQVEVVLIEPRRDDRLMFETSMMGVSTQREIARHARRTVGAQLDRQRARLATLWR